MTKSNGNGGPKSYSRFTKKDLKNLGIKVQLSALFPNVAPMQPSQWLLDTLKPDPSLRLGTESGKSHFIIAPIVREMTQRNSQKLSVFPGYTFDVDAAKGLTGLCDFVFSRDLEATEVEAPVFFIVEAKNENLDIGEAQCVAELYAAQLFNENASKPVRPRFGVVTFGREWQFYQLEGKVAKKDQTVYQIADLPKIIGILQHVIDMG